MWNRQEELIYIVNARVFFKEFSPFEGMAKIDRRGHSSLCEMFAAGGILVLKGVNED